jgi:hypothetical protein
LHFKQGLVRRNADRPDIAARQMATAAKQRQNPARIGVLVAANGQAEP